MSSQWSYGMAGPIGLRMEAMAFMLEVEEVPKHEWRSVLAGVQVMEQETLRQWRKQTNG